MVKKIKSIILLVRPEQWLKNLFVFAPIFFDKRIMDWAYVRLSLLAFAAFCFLASSIYCFNDIHDVKADRLHPVKCKRPIASGNISVAAGWCVMALCVMLSACCVFAEYLLHGSFSNLWVVLCCYFVLNLAYTLKLKHIVIVDVLIVAVGFVLRVEAGGASAGVYVSHWLVLMVFLITLFMALAKRRDDVLISDTTGVTMRKNISEYNYDFIDHVMILCTSVTMVCYIMYTFSEEVILRLGSHYLYLTALFVLAGIMRYQQLTLVRSKSGDPTKMILKDAFIQCCIVGWLITFFCILYL